MTFALLCRSTKNEVERCCELRREHVEGEERRGSGDTRGERLPELRRRGETARGETVDGGEEHDAEGQQRHEGTTEGRGEEAASG